MTINTSARSQHTSRSMIKMRTTIGSKWEEPPGGVLRYISDREVRMRPNLYT